MTVSSSDKICQLCGKDCSNVVNVKDRSGRYFCRVCFAQRINSNTRGPKKPAKPMAVNSADILHDIATSILPDPIEDACPDCNAPMPKFAVLCSECGHNLETGISTKGHKTVPGETQEDQRTWTPSEVEIEERLPTYKKNLFGFLTGNKYRRIEPDSTDPVVEDFGRFYQKSMYYCQACRGKYEIRRRLPSRRFHKLFCLFTLGLWLPIWLITEIIFRFRSWRCSNCRGRIRKALID